MALDIYKENHQNKDIIALIEKYPQFKSMYEQIYEICENIEQVMGMFSKELYELDRNTVQYMIDELQEEKKRWKEEKKRWKEEMKCWKEEKKRWKERDMCQQQEIERLRREMAEMKKDTLGM